MDGGRGFEGRPDVVELAQGLEVGIMPGKRAVVGIELDGAEEKRDGFVHLVAQGEDGRQHVQGVIVLGRLAARRAKMSRASS